MQARRISPIYESDWIETLDRFLKLSKQEILTNAEKISAKIAEVKVKEEYKKYKSLYLENIFKSEKNYVKVLEAMEMNLLSEGEYS